MVLKSAFTLRIVFAALWTYVGGYVMAAEPPESRVAALALASALHPRLGANSPAQHLQPNTLEMIAHFAHEANLYDMRYIHAPVRRISHFLLFLDELKEIFADIPSLILESFKEDFSATNDEGPQQSWSVHPHEY